MPRRSAPTPLRLVAGPLPGRGKPKHTLPSLPRPAFHPPARLSQGPVPRERARSFTPEPEDPAERATHILLAPVAIAPLSGASSPTSSVSGFSDGRRSRASWDSSRSSGERSRSASPPMEEQPRLRGPWDKHARSFSLPVDISMVVAPPRPVAINPVPVW